MPLSLQRGCQWCCAECCSRCILGATCSWTSQLPVMLVQAWSYSWFCPCVWRSKKISQTGSYSILVAAGHQWEHGQPAASVGVMTTTCSQRPVPSPSLLSAWFDGIYALFFLIALTYCYLLTNNSQSRKARRRMKSLSPSWSTNIFKAHFTICFCVVFPNGCVPPL